MVNQGTERYLGVLSVQTTGEAVNIADGQVGLFFKNRVGDAGIKVVDISSGDTIPNDEFLVLKAGIPGGHAYRGKDRVAASTIPFTKESIKGVAVSAPKSLKKTDDEIIIGYDGINLASAPVMYPGERREVSIILKGAPIEALGYKEGKLVEKFTVYAPDCPNDLCISCDKCEAVEMYPIFKKLQEDIKNRRISKTKTLADLIDVELIAEGCGTSVLPTTEDVEEWVISVPDSGLESDLQVVQSTTDGKVILKSREQGISTYSTTEFPYKSLTTNDLVIKKGNVLANCDTCPTGYTKSNGSGYLYTFKYDINKVASSDIDALIPVTIEGSKGVTIDTDTEFYQIVTEEALRKDELDVLLNLSGMLDVAEQGKVAQMCLSNEESTYSWSKSGETCKIAKFKYLINLKDECGTPGSKLDELISTFPDYNVQFESAVTSATCLSQYSCEVYSNVVCDNCAGYDSTFSSLPPASYMGSDWYCDPSTASNLGCKMGLRIRGGWLQLDPPDCVRFQAPYYDDSVLVDAAAGYNPNKYIDDPAKNMEEWSVTRVSAATKPTHQGVSFYKKVASDALYFLNETPSKDSLERYFKGEFSLIEPSKFYVDYIITLTERNRYGSGYSHSRDINYHLIVELGKHYDTEELVNKIAKLGGLSVISATTV